MKTVRICCGTGCLANGSAKVADEFERLLSQSDLDAKVECEIKRTGCNGFCENGPLVTILPDETCYYHVKVSDVAEILEKTIRAAETPFWCIPTGIPRPSSSTVQEPSCSNVTWIVLQKPARSSPGCSQRTGPSAEKTRTILRPNRVSPPPPFMCRGKAASR